MFLIHSAKDGIDDPVEASDVDETDHGPGGASDFDKATLDGVFDGKYFFLGHPVNKLDTKKRAELNKSSIGLVFRQYHLLDGLTVAENLDIPLSYRNIKASVRQGMVADTLDRFQMVGKKDLFPSQLSGGQQQQPRARPSLLPREREQMIGAEVEYGWKSGTGRVRSALRFAGLNERCGPSRRRSS